MRIYAIFPSVFALALAGIVTLGLPGVAQAGEELGASGTRLAIGGGAPRFYMTYGHADDAELFAPIIPELARLQITFRREGEAYAVFYKGERQGDPWPILRTREGAPETGDEPFVLLLGGSVFVPVRKVAELFPVDVRWTKGENLMVLSPDLQRPTRAAIGPSKGGPKLPAAAPAGGATITAVEVKQEGGELKVLVQTSDRIAPTTLHLKNPPRIVLDFPGARWADGLVMPEGAGDVRLLRTGYFQPPANPDAVAARLVLELNSPLTKVVELEMAEAYVTASIGRGGSRVARNSGGLSQQQRVQKAIRRRASGSLPRLPDRSGGALDGGLTLEEPNRIPRVLGPRVGNSLAGRTICVDAGHGGHSTGATGLQYKEKDLCLRISLELQRELEARGARVVMTRSDDTFVSLEGRCQIASGANADAFISIHLNSTPTRNSASGTETYWHTAPSFALAQALHTRMVGTVGKLDRGVRNRRFYVCRANSMPAVLLEVAFINNENDEQLLASQELHQNLAVSLAEGVIDFFSQR
jgi:N-acetylmuramoyl-L-alanine amidase